MWTDEMNQDDRDVEVPESIVRPKARLSFLTALAASALVLGVGGFGFILGHDVVKSPSATSTQSRVADPFTPLRGSNGFGRFGGFSPSISGPAQGGSNGNQDPAAAKVAKSVDPGLVDIDTNLGYQDAAAAGTGMILTKNGYVLTNNHVIEGATTITARDVETGKTYRATVVGYDATSDVAVLKLIDAKGLTTVTLGDSNDVSKDESVVGIGNAGGVGGTPSYAAGKVEALDQSITATDDGSPTGSERLSGLIEVSADIQPGDSGGPLVNQKGEVVGMDTAGSSSVGGFGFEESGMTTTQAYAIPINTALSIVAAIENGDGSTSVHIGSTAFIGIEVTDAASGGSSGGASATSGVTVQKVIPNTPAAATALTEGDTITSIDGEDVTTATELAEILQTLRSGQSIQIAYVDQNGSQSTVSLTLGSGPAQ